MGVILQKLGEAKLNNSPMKKWEVEYNSGDVVHIQTEILRLELTRKEFLELAEQIVIAGTSLRRRKGID